MNRIAVDKEAADVWIGKTIEFIPDFMKTHPVIRDFHKDATVILHGSITMGIVDRYADIDLWFLLPKDRLLELDKASDSRFFPFEIDGREGHMIAEDINGFVADVRHCDMDKIYQLRNAVTVFDESGTAEELITTAKRPMRKDVAEALFFYHYVEMRGEHRACDNPMNRNEPMSILFSLTPTLSHALKAAMVLDGQPFPYNKWLYFAAVQTPTGKLMQPFLENILDHFATDKLRFPGTDKDNPLTKELMGIRKVLVERAKEKGIDGPWLEKWWRFMDKARDAVKNITW